MTLLEVQDNEFAVRLTLDIPVAFSASAVRGSEGQEGGSHPTQEASKAVAAAAIHTTAANSHSSSARCGSSSSTATTTLRQPRASTVVDSDAEREGGGDGGAHALSPSRVFSVVLRMQLHRGSSVLCAAQLEPELFDLSSDVEAACLNEGGSSGGGGSSMRALLARVRVRLVQHWRREVQVEGECRGWIVFGL